MLKSQLRYLTESLLAWCPSLLLDLDPGAGHVRACFVLEAVFVASMVIFLDLSQQRAGRVPWVNPQCFAPCVLIMHSPYSVPTH